MGLDATGEVEAGIKSRTGGGDGGGSGQRLSGQDTWLPVTPAQLIYPIHSLSFGPHLLKVCKPTVCRALSHVQGTPILTSTYR